MPLALALAGRSPSEGRSPSAGMDIEPVEDEGKLSEQQRLEQAVMSCRSAQVRRNAMIDMLLDLPGEQSELAIRKAFVRVPVQGGSCVMAQVTEIEPSPESYTVVRKNHDIRTLAVQLRCQRGTSHIIIKVTSISNEEISEQEFMQWRRLTLRLNGDVEAYYMDEFRQKAEDIRTALNFTWTDDRVTQKLARKTIDADGRRHSLEFSAQKESRFRAAVQTTLSQMDISSVGDSEAVALENSYKQALEQLHEQERKAVETQEEWFKMRPNLYSLKMINEKNLSKQYADDKHALEYTLANEASGQGGLNPFQRRACMPVCAWDTALTAVELNAEVSPPAPSVSQSAPAASAAPAAAAVAPASLHGTGVRGGVCGEAVAPGSEQPSARMASMLQAHRRANLLCKLRFPAMTAKAA